MEDYDVATILRKPFEWDTFRCSLLAVCVLLVARHAGATDSSGTSAPTAGNDILEEIVITAERREEIINKVPISVTAFSQKTMDDLHIQSFNDLASIVPGMVVSTPQSGVQGSTDVAIRGIFSGGNAPTTQFYIDETPVAIRRQDGAGPAGSPHPLIFDLDRVEVLRGPQGTLFGSSAMGGAIRYITPQPNLTDASGYAKLDIGYTHNGAPNYEAGMAYGAPVVAGVAGFRVSGWFESESGFIDREDPFTGLILKKKANSSDSYVIRPAFTVVPAPGLSITTSAFLQHVHQNEPDLYWENFLPNPESSHVDGSLVREPFTDDLRVASVAIKYELPGVTLQSDTSYLDREYEDFNDITQGLESEFSGGNPFLPGLTAFRSYEDNLAFTHAWQQEFRLTSQVPDSRISWVAGAYYRNAVTGLAQLIPPDLSPITQAIAGLNSLQYFGNPDFVVNGQVLNSYTNFQTTDVQEALFGEITVDILPRVKANAGVRIEHSVVEHQNEIVAGPLNGLAYSNITLPDQVANPITPRFGLTYQYTDNDMVYATAAKGYRAGGGNAATSVGNALCDPSLAALGLTAVPKSFGPDTLWSYEIGAKDELFEKKLAIQASVYYINWTNIQTGVTLVSCTEGFTANRGKATSQGFDLQMAAIVAEGLKVSANVGYTDAYYPNAAYGAPINGVTPLLNGTGEKLPNVLPWTASLHTDYSRDIGSLWSDARSYLRVDFRWLSAATALNPQDNAYDPQVGPYQNQAYGTLDVRLGILHQGLDVSAYVLNATHSDPRLGFGHAAGGDPLFTAAAIRPLTAGFTAYYRF
jgi:outer membrane receptor protein involved in Fe transport